MQTATTLDISGFLDTIKGGLSEFTVANLGTILAYALAAAGGLAIAWFGYRFVKGKIVKALTKGKI